MRLRTGSWTILDLRYGVGRVPASRSRQIVPARRVVQVSVDPIGHLGAIRFNVLAQALKHLLVCSGDKHDTVTFQDLAKRLDLSAVTPGRAGARHVEPQMEKNKTCSALFPQDKEMYQELGIMKMGLREILRAELLSKLADIRPVLP